ncbi:MAG TPA: SPOR domain-containing protein [Acidobacteriaceae bacterium]|nr:SPOR domain-containing protein [Acidobacteriaceae bacterium]
MAFRFETEKEYEDVKRRRSGTASGSTDGSDTEIALGTRSLLAIFFGLVLICAVFFGLGYSVGRSSGTRAAAQPPMETATAAADSRIAKPSPDQSLTPVETPVDNGSPNTENPAVTQPGSGSAPAAASASSQTPVNPFQSTGQSPATSAATSSGTLQNAGATLPASFMVQVAAVRVPQDAQILVDALKKHGYSAVVRNEPQDQLLHIQLGPFPARSDAIAMRAKLLTDGYNAVVK